MSDEWIPSPLIYLLPCPKTCTWFLTSLKVVLKPFLFIISPTLPQGSVLIFWSFLLIPPSKRFLKVAVSIQPERPELCGVKVMQHEKMNTAKENIATGVPIRLF